jgi:hypothetical protein
MDKQPTEGQNAAQVPSDTQKAQSGQGAKPPANGPRIVVNLLDAPPPVSGHPGNKFHNGLAWP